MLRYRLCSTTKDKMFRALDIHLGHFHRTKMVKSAQL